MEQHQEDLVTQVNTVLADIRPMIQQDGGDLELIKVENDVVYIQFKGACIGCPFSFYTLTMGIEQTLKERIPTIKRVVAESPS